MTYSHTKIEQKWQKIWLKDQIFTPNLRDFSKPKYYLLDMFPYPSGKGLHVGHLRGYLGTDILTRMKMMQGYNVFHPIGFDSFGLPAEQYAIKTGNDPFVFTDKNINQFLQQLKSFGFAYDYQRVIKTHEPQIYQWTQWTFKQLFLNKLAVRKEKFVNFCPKLNTVLSNEEIIIDQDVMVSERGNHPVVRIKKEQWVIKIVEYAQKLLDGLKDLNWPEFIKIAQKNWIGKTDGYQLKLKLQNKPKTTLTLFANQYNKVNDAYALGISLENTNYDELFNDSIKKKLLILRKKIVKRPLQSKKILNKEPQGLITNLNVIHPWNERILPIVFVDYLDGEFAFGTDVLSSQHNVQDWFFAHHHQILTEKILLNHKKLYDQNIKSTLNHKEQINLWKSLTKDIDIKPMTCYLLKDWIFSRQRYWGEPFPVKKNANEWQALRDDELPLLLPQFNPKLFQTKNQKPPLSQVEKWVTSGYDVNTMPQWAGSCWYFLAYLLKTSDEKLLPLTSKGAKEIFDHWMPVDFYVGGQEHAVLHLLYARFWNRFLYQQKILSSPEPFKKLINQGLILAIDGKKMSKSKGNVVNPNDYLSSHGADAVRLHINFMGPFTQRILWNDNNLDSMRKWLARVYRLFILNQAWFVSEETPEHDYSYAITVKKVTEDFTNYRFNSAISQLMMFVNHCYKNKKINREYGYGFLKLLHPLCPHITSEIWEIWNQKKIIKNSWPTYKQQFLKTLKVKMAVQINGKTKKIIIVNEGLSQSNVESFIKKNLNLNFFGKIIIKIVFVTNKIINFVVRIN